jgi:hypothetical protein
MTDEETQKAGTFEAEFRRQMRSGQVRRFVNGLAAFSVQRDTPDEFARLLEKLDAMSESGHDIEQDNVQASAARMRHNSSRA